MKIRCNICNKFVTKDHDKDDCVENEMEREQERKLNKYLDGKIKPMKNTGMEDYFKKNKESE